MTWLQAFGTEFMHLTAMVLPYFAVGVAAGALLESTLYNSLVYRILGHGKRSIVLASLLGAILPGCACATMPMAEGLIRRGAKIGTVGAFIFTSPLLAPQTILLTYGMLGGGFTMARIICALVGGMGIGLLFYVLHQRQWITWPITTDSPGHECVHNHDQPRFWRSFYSIAKTLSWYFILGMAIASALSVSIPPTMIPSTIGQHPVFSYMLAALIGIPVYICEGEEIPITYSLMALGLTQGPAFTFLLGAVGTCIPTMLFAQKIIGKRPVVIYILFWAVFAPLSGILFSIL